MHVAQPSVRRNGAPHEEHCSYVEVVVWLQLVSDTEVQSAHKKREYYLVSNSGAQKLEISVVPSCAILHESCEALPQGSCGGTVDVEIGLLSLRQIHRVPLNAQHDAVVESNSCIHEANGVDCIFLLRNIEKTKQVREGQLGAVDSWVGESAH